MASKDDDFELGEQDNLERNNFPPAERTIHTQSYDIH